MTSNMDRRGDPQVTSQIMYTANPAFTRYGDDPGFAGERIVIVPSPMFSHKIGKGYPIPTLRPCHRSMGFAFGTSSTWSKVLRNSPGQFVEFTFSGRFADKIVFNRKEALAATDDILNDNGIRQQCSPDMLKIWDMSKSR